MRYCGLCGIPITGRLHETWLREFRAVFIQEDNWDDVRVSGVGLWDESRSEAKGTIPTDPSKRYDDALDLGSMIDVTLVMNNVPHLMPAAREPEPFWGQGFHLSCWNLFTTGFTPNLGHLFAACLSMPTNSGDVLDWGHDYGGAHFDMRNLGSMPQDLRSDPWDIPALAKAIKLSARLRDYTFQSRLDLDRLDVDGDGFSRLQPQLLQLIATLLPTRDVHSLRLASPVFATLSLPESFWASRFQQGNEFSDMPEVFHHPPESWQVLYIALGIWLRDDPNITNRRRIWKLAEALQSTLRQMEGVPCDGSPIKTWFEPTMPDGEDNACWRRAARGISNPRGFFRQGSRVLRARALHFSHPLEVQSMDVSFVRTAGGLFVSGLRFVDNSGQSHALGYLHHEQSILIQVPTARRIQGWELALDMKGIRAIELIAEDGTRSPWAGEPGDYPRWHLAEDEGISAVKAEFDGLKLVSLSRNSSSGHSEGTQWRNRCLWYPDIPPAERLIFNGNEGDEPPDDFEFPISTVFFGGPDGRDLSKLVEVVIWTFDLARVAGIEFLYGDGSQSRVLGHAGPFRQDHPDAKRFDISEGRRISLPIDGPGGEELRSIEVQSDGDIVGLKIRTNFGREVTSPQHPYAVGEEWVDVQPEGSKVIGLFATHGSPPFVS
ncbi:hypothetical protein ACJ41O_014932 [Fusarium nematophilum]